VRKNTQTDWTSYYSKNKSFWSNITQKATLKIIIDVINKWVLAKKDSAEIDLVELGGGNSCFAEAVCDQVYINRYDIVDNNKLSVELFNKKILKAQEYSGIISSVLDGTSQEHKYDFVYSVGLIEHFTKQEREAVIKTHFDYCTDDGYVLITFPTPTLKYRVTRKMMEILHVWRFWDETPLVFSDVKDCFEEYGSIESVEINKALPLTQMVVVVKKYDKFGK